MSAMKKKNYNKSIIYILNIVLTIIFFVVDRISKTAALNKLKGKPSVSVIPGILEFHYLENEGAAFGLLKGQNAFFIFVVCIVIIAIIYVIIKIPNKRKYIVPQILLSFIAAGALGNLADRIIYHYVIDFIYISAIKFPIFNVADIYVSVSSVILLILMLFVYKEEDLNFLRLKEKKIREL